MSVVFESMDSRGHEEVVFCYDKDTGLKAIIAVHNTTIGPALGGCRMWAYETEEDALKDVLRLSPTKIQPRNGSFVAHAAG
jgi:leucine dehydrogenase